ncbi:MAG TPA: helix-turn-helix domain-containing protein [Streptosporangiaceae bacterium]|jgi:excisionase family DNA binding protein
MPEPGNSAGRDPDVLTTDELAAKLGLSPQTVRRMAATGQIPALKAGKNFRYSWQAVRDVLRQPHHDPHGAAHDPADQPTDHPGDHGPRTTRTSGRGAGDRARRRAHQQANTDDTD